MLKSGDLHGVWGKEFAQEMEKKNKGYIKVGYSLNIQTDIEAVPSELSVPPPLLYPTFPKCSAEQIAKDSVCIMCTFSPLMFDCILSEK